MVSLGWPEDAHSASSRPQEYNQSEARKPDAPTYATWMEFLTRTTPGERLHWCAAKASRSNVKRLMSHAVDVRLTAIEVWGILEQAEGRCRYCGSLAVERRPSKPNGAPMPWEAIGRRIGSLDHLDPRFGGGSNQVANLGWACLWCNTWQSERKHGATDHGAISP